VDVSKGYLRNYLIPRKLAEPATKGSVAAARRRDEAAQRAVADATARAEESAALLNKTVLTIPHQAGDDGRLFGSVTSQDIVDAIKEARGITIDRRKVHLEEPIRTVGTRMVVVEVDEGVTATVKTMVVEQK
jgi:large subunit ribosomal protein L9